MSKRPIKRAKSGSEGERGRTCFVQGCSTSLFSAYERRYRLCATHRTISVFVIDGVKSRFCQKCGKFHDIDDFDEDRKSCRSSLMRHSQQQRATRQRRADRKAEEAVKAFEDHEGTEHGVEAVSVVERLVDIGSVIPPDEGALLLKPSASAVDASTTPRAPLRSQMSDADQLAATVDKLVHVKAAGMMPIGGDSNGGDAAPMQISPLAGSVFTGVASMEVLSVVPDNFDIDAALAAVEASLAATADGGAATSVPVATVASAGASPAFNAMDYAAPIDYFATARPAFGDAVVATATGGMWHDWGFDEGADPLAPVLDLPRSTN